ncbi:MAG: ABC transporter substrate-binding protein, partial [Opitutales bacterium]
VIEVTSKRIEVPVVISFPSGKTFNVLYRLGLLKTGWQIYDIVAEDISIVSNYRQQFDDHFRKGNGAQLIEKLEKLLKQEELDVTTIIL